MSNQIYTTDCFEQLPELDANSVHAIVTDPPYGLAFMGRSWDDFEPKEYQEWCEKWATECLRVLKPGGHLLAFSGNRTHHRLMSGIEDAGYEIRDTITWHYGSGFPKALDVSKAIDKRGGRSVKGVGPLIKEARESKGLTTRDVAEYFADEGQEPTGCVWNWENGDSNPTVENLNRLIEVLDLPIEPIEPSERDVIGKKPWKSDMTHCKPGEYGSEHKRLDETSPTTEQAKHWDGFKSALKPATEFVCVARSPLAEDTIAENVVTHGTGALNIDACRIGIQDKENYRDNAAGRLERHSGKDNEVYSPRENPEKVATTEGRYPSNVVFDEKQADVLDDEVGECETGDYAGRHATGSSMFLDESDNPDMSNGAYSDDKSGPSRYFYTSKASKAERTLDGKIDNAHPTVKPIDLMEWLVTLATAEEQIVLDPFAGSGTTCKAAKNKNRQFIGIEEQPKWADVARVRSGLPPVDHSHIRSDDAQHGLEQF